MKRANRYLKSLGSNYLLLLFNILYTIASVPVALHYLTEEEFGVWIVVSQIAGYLAMIDLGTSAAGIRLLVDHKDSPNAGTYGSLIKAAMAAQSIQAAAIMTVSFALMPFLAGWLKLPSPLVGIFNILWLWNAGLVSVNFIGRISVQLLSAHQRLDVVNYSLAAGIVASFAAMLLLFTLGFGIYSFPIGQTLSVLVVVLWTTAAAWRLRLFPSYWGPVTKSALHDLFGFGSEVFLVTLGGQMINGSQVFLVTRLLGIEAAAVWSVMTKVFTLLTQLVTRLIGVATPAFSEMFVRGENDLLCRRYRSVFELSVLASCYFGLIIAFGNIAFVDVWTKGRIQWHPVNDWLLAVWFILLIQSTCHNAMVVSTKRVQAAKFVYLFEGAAFITASVAILPRFGIPGMLVCSIVCTVLFTLAYGARRVAQLFELPARDIALKWLAPATRLMAIMLPIGFVLALFAREPSALRLAGCVMPLGIIAAVLAMRWCVSRDLAVEIISHLPEPLRRPANILFGEKPRTAARTL